MIRTVVLRADPARVRVAIGRAYHDGRLWCAYVGPRDGTDLAVGIGIRDDPDRALELALSRAAAHGLPGLTPDGAEYPHPQRREP